MNIMASQRVQGFSGRGTVKLAHLEQVKPGLAKTNARISSTHVPGDVLASALASQRLVRFAQQQDPSSEGEYKTSVRNLRVEAVAETYTPAFRGKFQKVLDDAKAFLKEQKDQGTNGIVVLDLDETLLDNREFHLNKKTLNLTFPQWMARGAPAIPETLEFVRWLEKESIPYMFITGRRERYRKVTEDNLKQIGVTQHIGLYLRDQSIDEDDYSAADFKTLARARIEQTTGQKILASIGDQESDIQGGFMLKGFRLPNPIYEIL
jgi:predicted secreted acid phosphatase